MITYLRTAPRPEPRKHKGDVGTSYGSRWVRLSTAFLKQYPFCVWCLVHGKMNEGAIEYPSSKQRSLVIDHIVPHRGDSRLFWDQENWQTLCRYPCHDKHKQQCDVSGGDWYEWLNRELCKESLIDLMPTHVANRILSPTLANANTSLAIRLS